MTRTTFKQFLMAEAEEDTGDKPAGSAEYAYRFEWITKETKHVSRWYETTLHFPDAKAIAAYVKKANGPMSMDPKSKDHDLGWVTSMLHDFFNAQHFYPVEYHFKSVGDNQVKLEIEYELHRRGSHDDEEDDTRRGILTIQEQG